LRKGKKEGGKDVPWGKEGRGEIAGGRCRRREYKNDDE